MNREFDSLEPNHPECEAVAALLVRSAVESLTGREGTALGDHLSHCERCRREAMEMGDFAASLRHCDRAIGGPSRRFSERVRARIAVERALHQKPQKTGAAPRKVVSPQAEAAARKLGTGAGFAPAAQSAPPRRFPRRSRGALWLAAGLVVSLGLNFWWGSRSLTGGVPFTGAPLTGAGPLAAQGADVAAGVAVSGSPAPGTVASLDGTVSQIVEASASPRRVAEQLMKLRAAQDGSGLLAGDSSATAWWLVAESRAKRAGVPLEALAFDAVGRAQRALAGAPIEGSKARAIAALGLAESGETLTTENPAILLAAAAELLGMSDVRSQGRPPLANFAEAKAAAIAKLASLEAAPEPLPRFDGNGRARLQVDTRGRDANHSAAAVGQGLSGHGSLGQGSLGYGAGRLQPLASGNGRGALAALVPAGFVASPASAGIGPTGSTRADALCAAAAASILATAR